MTENPYENPSMDSGAAASSPTRFVGSSHRSRWEHAFFLAAGGGVFMGGWCTCGFLAVFFLLEGFLAPPLTAQGNFGQFGLFVFITVPLGIVCGMSLGLLAFVKWRTWAAIYILAFGSLAWLSLPEGFDLSTTFGVAWLLCYAALIPFAPVAKWL